MPSQNQCAHLVRRAAPPSPLRSSLVSHPARPNPNLVRRVTGIPPISTPHTSSQTLASINEDDDEDENNEEQEEVESGQKRKRGRNLLLDALEEEVSKKKRKRGIVK
jgi:hypothetical protein